jgi:hypothetical protein
LSVIILTGLFLLYVAVLADRAVTEDVESSLSSLSKLACNWECVPMILEGLTAYIRGLLPLLEQREAPSVENGINILFNQIVQVIY